MVKWRSHGLCGGQTNILQCCPHLSTRNIFTYPRHDFYEVSVSKNAITSASEAINMKKMNYRADKRNVVDTLEEETDDDKSNHGVVKVE